MNTTTREELKRILSKNSKPYKVDKQIGEGNFGQAFLVTHNKEKKQVFWGLCLVHNVQYAPQ